MSTSLLRPPTTLTPSEALHRSQRAPQILAAPTLSIPYPLSLLTTSDVPTKWTIYENLFYSCLRTGDNASALRCLKTLQTRFGETNERVMGLMGLYHEAVAKDTARLEQIESQYKEVLENQDTNFAMRKRRVALLRSLGRTSEALQAVLELLDASPTDAEAWAEAGELYALAGSWERTVYCVEECLLVMPNAWNMHVKLGEILYISASTQSGTEKLKALIRALKEFCRSIELCDDYLRGFYGLKLTTSTLKETMASSSKEVQQVTRDLQAEEGYDMPSLSTVEKLNELATKKLAEIVRRSSLGESGWLGYAEAEVIAARELLDRDGEKVLRRLKSLFIAV